MFGLTRIITALATMLILMINTSKLMATRLQGLHHHIGGINHTRKSEFRDTYPLSINNFVFIFCLSQRLSNKPTPSCSWIPQCGYDTCKRSLQRQKVYFRIRIEKSIILIIFLTVDQSLPQQERSDRLRLKEKFESCISTEAVRPYQRDEVWLIGVALFSINSLFLMRLTIGIFFRNWKS